MRKARIIFICLFALQTAIGLSQDKPQYSDDTNFPSGKIGERIQSFIDTFNSDDPSRVESFINRECTGMFAKMPMDEHIKMFLSLRKQTGGIDFYSIRTFDPTQPQQTVVIAKDRNFNSWWAFHMFFDEENEFLITGMRFTSADPPLNWEEPELSQEEFIQKINTYVELLCKKEVFSGAVLVAKGERILYKQACGEASKRFHVPNNIETKFNLGSMNKMFTSTAIMQLVEKGNLSLSDTIDKYVDESWLPKDVTSKISIHHLLSHTSGLGSYFNDVYAKSSRTLFRKLDDYKPLIKDERPAFEPGKRFLYSNTGMFLLGVVIESVTGEDYFDHIRKNIYEPAGMINSDCYDMDEPVENLAIGYSPDPQSKWQWENNLYKHVIRGGPAGGGFSTIEDLHRFALALLSDKFVSKQTLETMWTKKAGENYGYGFQVKEGSNGKVVGHSGGFPGINSNLDIYLDKGYIVAVMSNIDNGASPLARSIDQMLTQIK